jgi:hypothetical protein
MVRKIIKKELSIELKSMEMLKQKLHYIPARQVIQAGIIILLLQVYVVRRRNINIQRAESEIS